MGFGNFPGKSKSLSDQGAWPKCLALELNSVYLGVVLLCLESELSAEIQSLHVEAIYDSRFFLGYV